MALSGTWVSDCIGDVPEWSWEKFVFDGKTGQMTVSVENFDNENCRGSGTVEKSTTGTYSTGAEITCPSGWEGKCREWEMTLEGRQTNYALYSLFPGTDPDQIYLSSTSNDPAARAEDVVIDARHHLRNIPCPGNTGDAIVAVTVIDSGYLMTPPAPPPGYSVVDIDLNGGTMGTYVWLYYAMGRADGLEGTPIERIYTVHESDGETPLRSSDTKVDVNLNGTTAANNFLYIYFRKKAGAGPVVRCVVVANESEDVTLYGPPIAYFAYSNSITWIEELDPGPLKTPSAFPQPPDAQDLNEGFGGDWIFLGYAVE